MLNTAIWRVAGIVLLLVSSLAWFAPPATAQTPELCLPSTPETDVAVEASPEASPVVALPDTDLAWMNVQDVLATSSADLATVALPDLVHEELRSYAEAQIATARTDLDAIETWRSTLYPDADFPLVASLATIFSGKQQLDLPAGAGGTDAVGASSAIQALCSHPADADMLYLQASIDLAQQQVELAQVAVVFAEQPEISGYAQEIIEREQANTGQLLTWQEEWLNPAAATPAG